jgi:PAS domain S-box-containing protein
MTLHGAVDTREMVTGATQGEAAVDASLSHALFESAPDAILLADDQARYVDANPAACELTGYSREELLRLHVWDVAPTQQPRATQRAWRTFLRRGSADGEFVLRRKDGTTVEAEFRAVANVVPGVHASFLRPSGERKARAEQAEQQARQQERTRLVLLFQDSARHLLRQLGADAAPEGLATLTEQERRILRLIAAGQTNRQIAAEIGLSPNTVKDHVSNLFRKLRITRRAEAAAIIAQHRLPPGL